jgi:polar amino acid transport system permease protein
MNWDWNFAFDVLPDLLYAFARFTLVATVLGTLLAAVLGLAFAIIRRARVPVLAPVTTAFIEFVRSTPLLVQLFFLYFVLAGLRHHAARAHHWCHRIGRALRLLPRRGLSRGHRRCAKGPVGGVHRARPPPRLQWQHVILPQAIRNVLPALGNYAISMFKETPFLALITVPEMVQRSQAIGSISFRYLEPITLAGLIFLAASYPTAIALRKLEMRLGH